MTDAAALMTCIRMDVLLRAFQELAIPHTAVGVDAANLKLNTVVTQTGELAQM